MVSYTVNPTFPSVTVRKVSITDNFTSKFGVSSRKPMTTCTIFVVACLSWPCFFDNSRTWSFNRLQSPASLQIVTIVTRILEVVARSEAWKRRSHISTCRAEFPARSFRTCLACFSNTDSLSIAAWILVCSKALSTNYHLDWSLHFKPLQALAPQESACLHPCWNPSRAWVARRRTWWRRSNRHLAQGINDDWIRTITQRNCRISQYKYRLWPAWTEKRVVWKRGSVVESEGSCRSTSVWSSCVAADNARPLQPAPRLSRDTV